MKTSIFALLLTLAPFTAAHAAGAPQEPANCYQHEWQTIEDAGAEAIFHGDLDNHTSNLECLKALVAHGLDLSKPGIWGSDRSALASAAHAGNPEILKYILSQGVSIGNMNDTIEAQNLGDIAAVGGSGEVVKTLHELGMPISYANPKWPRGYMKPSNHFLDTCSPMMHAALDYLRPEVVSYLLAQGMDVNARCSEDTLLMSNEGYPTPLLKLADSIEAYDSLNGDVKGRRVIANQLLKTLIDAGGDLNAREDINGRTAASLLLRTNWISAEMKAYVKAHAKR